MFFALAWLTCLFIRVCDYLNHDSGHLPGWWFGWVKNIHHYLHCLLLFVFPADDTTGMDAIFIEKLDEMGEQGIDDLTIEMAAATFADVPEISPSKKKLLTTPKRSLWSQEKDASVADDGM